MAILDVHYTSARTKTGKDDWRTPHEFYERLAGRLFDDDFGFDLDAAASPDNAMTEAYLSPAGASESCGDEKHVITTPCDTGALGLSWQDHGSRVFCNPPYSMLRQFMAKAHAEARGPHPPDLIAMLIAARTDTIAWHEHAMNADEIILVRGRLKFGGAATGAPFPSAVIVFHGGRGRTMGPRLTTMLARRLNP